MTFSADDRSQRGLRESATFDRATIAAIHRAAETGIYDIRGWGAKRAVAFKVITFTILIHGEYVGDARGIDNITLGIKF